MTIQEAAHPPRPGIAAICAASVIAVGHAVMGHEAAHVVAGRLAGGSSILMTATEVRGDFGSLSLAGLVALGAAGTVANLLLCALGWWAMRRGPVTAEFQMTAWFFFAVNGMLVTTKMMVEPVAGFGDWMSILRPWSSGTTARVLVGVLGAAGVAFMVRRSGAALGGLVPPGEAAERSATGFRIVLTGALAAATLVLGASVASPFGTTRTLLLALGAGLGPFLPLVFGVRLVRRTPSRELGPSVRGIRPWLMAAATTIIIMWVVVGPGIRL